MLEAFKSKNHCVSPEKHWQYLARDMKTRWALFIMELVSLPLFPIKKRRGKGLVSTILLSSTNLGGNWSFVFPRPLNKQPYRAHEVDYGQRPGHAACFLPTRPSRSRGNAAGTRLRSRHRPASPTLSPLGKQPSLKDERKPD